MIIVSTVQQCPASLIQLILDARMQITLASEPLQQVGAGDRDLACILDFGDFEVVTNRATSAGSRLRI